MKPKTEKAIRAGKSLAGKKSRASYLQGRKTIYVEPLENIMAVRYFDQSKERVHEAVSDFGQIRDLDSKMLFIIDFADETDRAEAADKLQGFLDKGMIEFFTPVLVDEQSQLRQILTDEINVRFKQVPLSSQLRAVEKKYGVKVARRNEFAPNQFIVKTSQLSGLNTLKVASELDAEDEIEFAAPNFISEHRR